MPAASALDNPIWHALIGPQASFATGQGGARRYQPAFAPFAAIEADSAAAYRDLASEVPRDAGAVLFRPADEPALPGWQTANVRILVQMVADSPVPLVAPSSHGEPIPLGPNDDMHELVARAEPGPFATRTPELGYYVGYRGADRLRAMGGERLRLPDAVELSAIAVDQPARGLGLGAAVVSHLARRIQGQGKLPFLHVFPDNPAMVLYQRLGFRERRRMFVIWRTHLTD